MNDKPIDVYALGRLRQKIAVVPQDLFLYAMSIKDRICNGKSDATLDEVKECAEMADIATFIESLPDQYDTEVGERGVKLSQGQRQRIAIARALIKNASLIILDEATSALDVETENNFQVNINKLSKNCTKIVIAHRLATVKDADYIAFVDKGKVVEYGTLEEKHAQLIDIVVDDKLVDKADGEHATLIFDKTPFYAERGGQVADHGEILNQNGELVARVTDVQHAPNDQNLHFVDVILPLEKGQEYVLKVDQKRRRGLKHNHTATHLLHAALREVLGTHTHQAGSLVEPDYLRFDFTSLEPMTKKEIASVEKLVNEKIWEEIPVKTTVTDPDTGLKMGALALFGEKYGDTVRVVQIDDFSTEFCGGTHCENTDQIGMLKIVSESAVGAGTRRIIAVTGPEAYKYVTDRDEILKEVQDEVKATKAEDVVNKISSIEDDLRASQKEAEQLKAQINKAKAGDLFNDIKQVKDLTVIAVQADVEGMNDLRELADNWKSSNKSDVLVLAAEVNGKANMVISLDDKAIKAGLKAGDLIKTAAPIFGGGGGGRPNMAQAGGKNPAGLKDAIAKVLQEVEEKQN